MRDDFAIFILTHGRADQQRTWRTLRDSGYTGKIYLLIDDLDEQKDRYQKRYRDSVIVFDKRAQAEKTDTFFNGEELRAVVYARNASFEIAEEMGLKWFVNCDDDISRFDFKMPIEGKLKTAKIRNMDAVLESVIRFMEDTGTRAVSFSEGGNYIGGVNGKVRGGVNWMLSHFFMFRAGDPMRFRSVWYEDRIFSNDKAKEGLPIFGLMQVAITLPTPESRAAEKQEGGMHEAYEESGAYIASFCVAMAHPDHEKVYIGYKGKRWNNKRRSVAAGPKIISSRYQKAR